MRPTVDLVGHRVSVRHVHDGSATDVVGRVLAVTDRLVVERRDGRIAEVPIAAVVAWKVVPDRPVRTRRASDVDAEDLTRITSRGWPATESVPLGAWELRAAAGFTGRANSVAVTGDPGLPVADALDQVEDFYRARGLPPLAQVVVGSRGQRDLEAHGWRSWNGSRPGAVVQVADLRQPPPADADVVVSDDPDDVWLSLYQRVGDEDPAVVRAVLTGPPTVGFASVGDPVVGIGRVVVTGEWAGLSAGEVSPEHRRQGLATRIVDASLAWAAARGADKAYLQTMPDNTAALALYARLGFTTHHEYRYLAAPPR